MTTLSFKSNMQALLTMDSNLLISSGAQQGVSHVNKFGENGTIAGDATGVIWDGMGTSYPFPSNTFATGTVTTSTAVADDTVTLNGLVYTGVAGAAADFTEFSIDTGNNETATSLAAAITGDTRTGTVGDCTASASSAVVTITTDVVGISGNAVTLASSDGATLAVSAATLTAGAFEVMTKLSQTTNQAALVGAVIEVQGLDVDWNLVTQTKALNASDTTTAVTLDTPLIRVFRMKVLANVVTDQPVRCHNTAESVDYAIIQAGNNQTLMAIYTVPAGKTAYVVSYYGDVVPTATKEPVGTDFTLWVADRANAYEFQLKHAKGSPQYAAGPSHSFSPYMKVNEKSDIMMKATCYAEEGQVHGGFDLILIDN